MTFSNCCLGAIALGLCSCTVMKEMRAKEDAPPPVALATVSPSAVGTRAASFEFEELTVGGEPEGWVATSTGSDTIGRWEVMQGPEVPSQSKVVALATPNGDTEAFNILWRAEPQFRNGRLTVDLLAREGEVDQGGGPIWRVQDADNYYICRWNPLEKNFRLYVVVNGERRQRRDGRHQITPDMWRRIVVTHHGDQITCTLSNQVTIGATDNSIPDSGGVGLWTKADALTAFDGLTLSPE